MYERESGTLGVFVGNGSSTPIDIRHLQDVTIAWSGTYYGTVDVQISNDGASWVRAPGFTPVADSVGSHTIQCHAAFARVAISGWGAGTFAVGRVVCSYSGVRSGRRYGVVSVGSLDGDGTTSAADVSHLGDAYAIVHCLGESYTGNVALEVSADGSTWAQYGSTISASACVALPGRVRFIRGKMTSYGAGEATILVTGVTRDAWSRVNARCRAVSVGVLDAVEATSGADVSDLHDTTVVVSFASGASATVVLEQQIGTWWVQIPGTSAMTSSTVVAIEPSGIIRARATAHSTGAITVYAFGAQLSV